MTTLLSSQRASRRSVAVMEWPERMRRLLPAGLLLLVMGCILDFGAVYPSGTLAVQLGTALLFAGYLYTQLDDFSFNAKPIYLPLLFLGALVLAQLIFHRTAYWYASYQEALLWTAYLLLFTVASETFTTERAAQLAVTVLAIFGPLLALFALVQHFSGTDKIYWLHAPQQSSLFIFGPYVNRNHYAGAMEMLLPFCALLGIDRELRMSLPLRGLCLFGAAVMFASVFVSASRTGVLCALVELLLLAVYWQTRSGLSRTKAAAVFALALLGTAAFSLWLDPTHFVERAKMLNMADELSVGRTAMYRDAVHMLRVHPFFGFGLHTFSVVFPAYRSFHTVLFINELHNDWLQVLVELGAFGGIALLVFVVMLYRCSFPLLYRAAGYSYARVLRTASLIGTTGLLIHSFFDFNLHIPANAAFFFVLCAWGSNREPAVLQVETLPQLRRRLRVKIGTSHG